MALPLPSSFLLSHLRSSPNNDFVSCHRLRLLFLLLFVSVCLIGCRSGYFSTPTIDVNPTVARPEPRRFISVCSPHRFVFVTIVNVVAVPLICPVFFVRRLSSSSVIYSFVVAVGGNGALAPASCFLPVTVFAA